MKSRFPSLFIRSHRSSTRWISPKTECHFLPGSCVWRLSRSPPPPETLLFDRLSVSAGGFLISSGALAFSCEAPGPPWRMLAGVFVEVDISSSCRLAGGTITSHLLVILCFHRIGRAFFPGVAQVFSHGVPVVVGIVLGLHVAARPVFSGAFPARRLLRGSGRAVSW